MPRVLLLLFGIITMTKWAAVFLVAAIAAGFLGFGEAGASASAAAQITFVLCSVGLLVSLVLGTRSEPVLRPSKAIRRR